MNRHSKFVSFCRNYGVLSSADIYGRFRSNATRKWTEDGYVSDDQMQVTCENYASMVCTYERVRSCIVIFVLYILICAYAWNVTFWIHVYVLIFLPPPVATQHFHPTALASVKPVLTCNLSISPPPSLQANFGASIQYNLSTENPSGLLGSVNAPLWP